MFDDFGYDVPKVLSAATKRSLFAAKGWTWCKDDNQSTGARGYIYTTTTVDGYSGQIPGSSGRVLGVQGTSLATQGDLYLQYGNGNIGALPPAGWIQFWYMMNNTAAEPSVVTGGKLIYPLPSGSRTSYPADTLETGFLLGMGADYRNSATTTINQPNSASVAMTLEAMAIVDQSTDPAHQRSDVFALRSVGASRYMYPWLVENTPAAWLSPNQWYLIKIRYDISGATGRFEAWVRTLGSQVWTKTHEWIGGTTSGFSWNTFSPDNLGWRYIKIPTTLRGNFWMYLADYAHATTESALPTYTSY